MLLRNFDYAAKYLNYKSRVEIEMVSDPQINGWYKFIDGILSGLLVMDNNLYYLHGEEIFLITSTSKVLLNKNSKFENEFCLIDEKEVLVKFSYSTPDSKLNVTPFEYIDEDDFKWSEFVEKIINDEERTKNFIMNLMEN